MLKQMTVMPGLVPGIHDLPNEQPWMAGTSPAMTNWDRRSDS